MPLDRRNRAGLCAYPADPDGVADKVFCILADLHRLDAQVDANEYGFVSHGEEWSIYKAKYEDVGGPIRRWPSERELRLRFQEIGKLTPMQGLKKSQQVYDEYEKLR